MSVIFKASRPVVDFTEPAATQRVPADVGLLVSGRDLNLLSQSDLVSRL